MPHRLRYLFYGDAAIECELSTGRPEVLPLESLSSLPHHLFLERYERLLVSIGPLLSIISILSKAGKEAFLARDGINEK